MKTTHTVFYMIMVGEDVIRNNEMTFGLFNLARHQPGAFYLRRDKSGILESALHKHIFDQSKMCSGIPLHIFEELYVYAMLLGIMRRKRLVVGVTAGSQASAHMVQCGWTLLTINGERVVDGTVDATMLKAQNSTVKQITIEFTRDQDYFYKDNWVRIIDPTRDSQYAGSIGQVISVGDGVKLNIPRELSSSHGSHQLTIAQTFVEHLFEVGQVVVVTEEFRSDDNERATLKTGIYGTINYIDGETSLRILFSHHDSPRWVAVSNFRNLYSHPEWFNSCFKPTWGDDVDPLLEAHGMNETKRRALRTFLPSYSFGVSADYTHILHSVSALHGRIKRDTGEKGIRFNTSWEVKHPSLRLTQVKYTWSAQGIVQTMDAKVGRQRDVWEFLGRDTLKKTITFTPANKGKTVEVVLYYKRDITTDDVDSEDELLADIGAAVQRAACLKTIVSLTESQKKAIHNVRSRCEKLSDDAKQPLCELLRVDEAGLAILENYLKDSTQLHVNLNPDKKISDATLMDQRNMQHRGGTVCVGSRLKWIWQGCVGEILRTLICRQAFV